MQQKIYEAVKRHGSLANLWWKQKDLDERYSKAISRRAILLNYTKKFTEKNKQQVLDYFKKNKFITIREVRKLLDLSLDRAHLLLKKLTSEGKIFVINAGSRSYYSIENEDISIEKRKEIIIKYLENNKKIYNRDARKLLALGNSRSYKILKELTCKRVLKQIKKMRGTYYVLQDTKTINL